ncbi:PACE efflux transporter [Aliiglaciecola sp. CAU 1673]|uniref:PACE efflux transporter n=1 Tax=Aliiglaciecola sp. CAU 1673 TaxID=3032595 RepID=UPI0023D9AD32|nr:PACE efflux transporter [Aliiglaciecola sp. CAU 1673]MDF2178486.1 PACE efflux transporter [Aliiglaciecola sp. CAU 1673]
MNFSSRRVYQVLGYQAGSLLVIAPILSLVSGHNVMQLGTMTLVIALICMLWSYLFNSWFDTLVQRRGKIDSLPGPYRLLHALGIEIGVIWFTTPIIAWWLSLSLWQALVMDMALVAVYFIYTLFYYWLFDALSKLGNKDLAY